MPCSHGSTQNPGMTVGTHPASNRQVVGGDHPYRHSHSSTGWPAHDLWTELWESLCVPLLLPLLKSY